MKKIVVPILRITAVTFIIFMLNACGTNELPAKLSGTYSGKADLILRSSKAGKLVFVEDSVFVNITISNTLISGNVGNANFEACTIRNNRGWLSRKLNLKTDFLIKGKLSGIIYDKDSTSGKVISIPFNLTEEGIEGSVFLASDEEKIPIISFLKLKKQ